MGKGSTTKIITVNCTSCGKEFNTTEWKYNHRLERNQERGVFCSPRCGQIGKKLSEEHRKKISEGLEKSHSQDQDNHITISCATCNKEFILRRWEYNDRMRKNPRALFCSVICSLTGKRKSEETKQKIKDSQKGISVSSRGRPGHIVTEETKQKIRDTKKKNGFYRSPDWDIVLKAAERLGLEKYVTTKAPVPDILFIEDGKLIAVEVEKKPHETQIRKKMDNHTLNTGYDKVILMWFLPTGEFMKQWILENGKWRIHLINTSEYIHRPFKD